MGVTWHWMRQIYMNLLGIWLQYCLSPKLFHSWCVWLYLLVLTYHKVFMYAITLSLYTLILFCFSWEELTKQQLGVPRWGTSPVSHLLWWFPESVQVSILENKELGSTTDSFDNWEPGMGRRGALKLTLGTDLWNKNILRYPTQGKIFSYKSRKSNNKPSIIVSNCLRGIKFSSLKVISSLDLLNTVNMFFFFFFLCISTSGLYASQSHPEFLQNTSWISTSL
jgi:hypothetical protein